MDVSFISKRITELRLALNVSEYQISLELGKSKSYIQSITSGQALPSVTQLLEICNYFEMTPAEFFDEGNHDSLLLRSAFNKLRHLEEEDLQMIVGFADRLLKGSAGKDKE